MKAFPLFLVACLTGLLAAAAALGPPPAWLLTAVLATFMLAAMFFGFTGLRPALPLWATSRPVLGVTLFALGLAAVFVPAQFVAAAFLTGSGIRLLWLSVSEPPAAPSGRRLARKTRDLSKNEAGGPVTVTLREGS